jgi:YegS/Rv2252/BmrU family lipid kinase
MKMSTFPVHNNWFIIVNPNAGNGKGKKDWNRISGLLERNSIVFEAKFTERKGQAIEFAREATANGFRKLVSVGGDGTLNEVVNGIFTQDNCSPQEVSVGMIPVGTGNDWGRMFGIPTMYEGAVKVLKENKTMPHDIGLISFYNGNIRKTNIKKDKGRSSRAIYFYNLLSSLLSYKKIISELTIDGKTSSCKVFSINVGNGRYCGGGMRQTPDALPDDGLLDITVIRDMSRIEVIKSLKLLYDGTILSHQLVDGYRSNNLKVTSNQVMFAEADGETLGHTPVEFSIIPAGINVIYGVKIIQ